MSSNFKQKIESASLLKQRFDYSMENLKEDLEKDIQGSTTDSKYMEINNLPVSTQIRTGWLRGALSYPWMLVCIVIPAVLDMLM